LLFVPGDSARKLAKAETTNADALILDLEDSVAPAQADAARQQIRSYLLERPATARHQEIWVRCNPVQSEAMLHDIAAVADAAPDVFLVPKVRTGADLEVLHHHLSALEVRAGLPVGGIALVPTLTEAPQSILHAHTFTAGLPRLRAMSWGPIDLMAALGASTNRAADGSFETFYVYARGLCIVTARAAGVAPIDTISADYRDLDALKRECAAARSAGFMGKLAIHPDQIAVINEAFSPSAAEIAEAERVVSAFESTSAGTVGLDGRMLDAPHLRQAREILSRAREVRTHS